MKLVLCKICQDVFKCTLTKWRTCKCGACGGRYLDRLQAEYFGNYAVPLGFANSSLVEAIENQPQRGWGKEFTAFVIQKECPTFDRVDCPEKLRKKYDAALEKYSQNCLENIEY